MMVKEGYSNAALSHWSKLNGDGELVWGPDAQLTPLGGLQAEEARRAWQKELTCGMPVPEKLFASPLRRALETWRITFDGNEDTQILPPEQRRVLILEVSSLAHTLGWLMHVLRIAVKDMV